MTRIAIHGHFYQPPRENPWTGMIDYQPGAAPFHDWNERVHAESYRANAYANIVGPGGEQIVNNFELISFDIGPTLMAWLEDMHPRTYQAILRADQAGIERLGYGNALAQAFHHSILPLASLRDVRTEVRWGLADFRHRFGRAPEGMWLPETAVDDDVLGVLIEEGLDFTILAPHQAGAWRRPGGDWHDVSEDGIDTRLPYSYLHPDGSGRSIALFFYDGPLSREIAFENITSSATGLIDAFESRADDRDQLIHVATDGETYGHHHKFADIGLAYALHIEAVSREVEVVNHAWHLAKAPPRFEVKLVPGASSWSCAHGVGRWAEDCGCSTGGLPGWDQRWRAPLRAALDLVRDAADETFERMGAGLFADPWRARDEYVDVVIGAADVDDLIAEEALGHQGAPERATAARLLELQRNSLAMFTSCGWFFNDISGIETIQILRYAARALELLDELGQSSPRHAFVAKLEEAKSNDPAAGTGADIFLAIEP